MNMVVVLLAALLGVTGLKAALLAAIRAGAVRITLPILFLDARLGGLLFPSHTLSVVYSIGFLFTSLLWCILTCYFLPVQPPIAERVLNTQSLIKRAEQTLRVVRAVMADAQDMHHALRSLRLVLHVGGTSERLCSGAVYTCVFVFV